MNRVASVSIAVVIMVAMLFLAGVCWHSVGEIHYLKTFYPTTFSMDQAYEASMIEVIKVAIISFPVVVAIMVGLYVLKNFRRGR
jgi:hypothetical protein